MAQKKITKQIYEQKYPDFAKSEAFSAVCLNHHEFYYFVNDLSKSYIAKCPYCSLVNYVVTCPNCESGFFYSHKEISEIGEWKCEVCNNTNRVNSMWPEISVYKENDLPEEVFAFAFGTMRAVYITFVKEILIYIGAIILLYIMSKIFIR